MTESHEWPAQQSPWQSSLAREYELAGRRAPLDLWLALAACGIGGSVLGCVAAQSLRGGLQIVGEGEIGFVVGWAILVVGVLVGGLAYAHLWIARRLLAADPVAPLAGAVLGGAIAVGMVGADDLDLTGLQLGSFFLAEASLAVLALVGPGIRRWVKSGQYGDTPLSFALALLVARAQALCTAAVGVAILPGGRYESSLYLWALALLCGGIGLAVAARRAIEGSRPSALLLAGAASANALLGLFHEVNSVTLIGMVLAAVVVYGLLRNPASRVLPDGTAVTRPLPAPVPGLDAWTPPAPRSGEDVPDAGLQAPAAAAPVAPAPVVPAPVAPAPVAPAPSTAAASDVLLAPPPSIAGLDDAVDGTVMAAASRATRVCLVLDSGEVLPLAARCLVGRRPAVTTPIDEGAALLPVEDPTASVSKTHFAMGLEGARVWVEDRHSTNGIAVLAADGSERYLVVGERVSLEPGSSIRFGRRTAVVSSG